MKVFVVFQQDWESREIVAAFSSEGLAVAACNKSNKSHKEASDLDIVPVGEYGIASVEMDPSGDLPSVVKP